MPSGGNAAPETPPGLFSLWSPPSALAPFRTVSVDPPGSAGCADGAAGTGPDRTALPQFRPTKPFWGTRETILKHGRRRSVARETAPKTPGGSDEPLHSLSGPLDPPENRGFGSRGRHRGGWFRHLRPQRFGLHPDRPRH